MILAGCCLPTATNKKKKIRTDVDRAKEGGHTELRVVISFPFRYVVGSACPGQKPQEPNGTYQIGGYRVT